jgi:nicotinate dehydrogenase subunit A
MLLQVNGRTREILADCTTPLLHVLRNDLRLNGPKFGCGLGECGASTVVLDGLAARSCVISVGGCAGRSILTLEGLGWRDDLDPIQSEAAQCGYCLNGMIMTTKALLTRNAHPSEQEAAETLKYNLCRCGAHVEILRAVMRAASETARSE